MIDETKLAGVELARRGKVRDVYRVDDALLIVATDRISAFDVVLPTPIPDKGRVLTQLSLYWFDRAARIVPHHVLAARVEDYPEPLRRYGEQLEGRSMLVRRARPIPFECVVRGYLYGSGWEDYRRTGAVCGIALPAGLRLAEKLPEPLFTPATKAESGHDLNVSEAEMASSLGEELTARLKELSLRIYRMGAEEAASKGILIADTKLEFGFVGDELVLIDELLTPDSSRFWPADSYRVGESQPSYDKQFVRDYLTRIGWNRTPPGPELPPDVVEGTRRRYREAYRALTGRDLD